MIRYCQSKDLLVILDAKRGDIGTTAEAYARGLVGRHSPWGGDALTVNPYLGDDSLAPFVSVAQERRRRTVCAGKDLKPWRQIVARSTA